MKTARILPPPHTHIHTDGRISPLDTKSRLAYWRRRDNDTEAVALLYVRAISSSPRVVIVSVRGDLMQVLAGWVKMAGFALEWTLLLATLHSLLKNSLSFFITVFIVLCVETCMYGILTCCLYVNELNFVTKVSLLYSRPCSRSVIGKLR